MATVEPIIYRISYDIAVTDEINQRKINRLASEARQNFLMTVYDEEEIGAGLIKDADLEFELGQPQGHVHFSAPGNHCQHSEGNCVAQALDGVRPHEQEV